MDRALISSLAFWADAGVDTAYADHPLDRLKPVERRPPPGPPVRLSSSPSTPTLNGHPSEPDLAGAVESARALAAEAQDLDSLKLAIAAFEGCPLKRLGAEQAVFARGNPQAPIMLIGEGPGADEDQKGEPFVGRAGKLLDKMMFAAGLEQQVFVTNTVFWRPPDNRTPTAAEQSVCLPFVERAITLVRPRLLLLVGGASAKGMLRRNEGILTLRGNWIDWTPTEGGDPIPALATLHPAFLLRQPLGKKKAWQDLMTLSARLEETRA